MSHPQNCFCEVCRGENQMPAKCQWCDFVHTGGPEKCPEVSFNMDGDIKCTCYQSRGKECPIHMTIKENQPVEQAEKEPTDDMGLLSKYKPRDDNGVKSFKRRDFLKKEHFPKSGKLPATIIELRDAFEGSFSDLLLDVKCGREEYTVGVKFDSVLLDQLVSELGQDEKRWRGKHVVFELAKGKYINLQREKASAGRKAGKSKSKR